MPTGKLTPLPQQNIDTGLGLERGAMLLQDVDSIFDTDGYQAIMRLGRGGVGRRLRLDSGRRPRRIASSPTTAAAMAFLIAEGITPSNEGRGYIVRRLIRRAVQQGSRIGLDGRLPTAARSSSGRWRARSPSSSSTPTRSSGS